MVRITAWPDVGLFDEVVQIKVSELNPEEEITILATTVETNHRWQSHAHYKANKSGSVELNSDSSCGGDYTGIEPMGLFWSLKLPEGQYITTSSPDFVNSYLIVLDVFRGYNDALNLNNHDPICTVMVKRSCLSESVSRIPIRHGNVRGVLFVPKNAGTHPGVIDIRGAVGINEPRPALLATKGFVTLALAHSGYEDLPKVFHEVDLEYFKEAVDFLLSHEKVDYVGVLGSSFGGSIALAMSGCIPDIKSVVLISSPLFPHHRRFKYRERKWDAREWNLSQITILNDALSYANVFTPLKTNEINEYMPRFQDSEASILSIESKDDGLGHMSKKHKLMKYILDVSGKTNYKFVEYEKAGHHFDIPYLPLFAKVNLNVNQIIPLLFGGSPKEHAKAQEKGWSEIIKFLHLTLNADRPKSKL